MKRLVFGFLALAACGGSPAAPPPQPPPPSPVDAGAPDQAPTDATTSARSSSPVRFGAVVVTGKVDREAVVQALRKLADAFHTCAIDPKLDGRVTLHFDIAKDGRPANITADRASDITDPKVQACVAQQLQMAIFPMPSDGIPGKVIAPIIFEPKPSE